MQVICSQYLIHIMDYVIQFLTGYNEEWMQRSLKSNRNQYICLSHTLMDGPNKQLYSGIIRTKFLCLLS